MKIPFKLVFILFLALLPAATQTRIPPRARTMPPLPAVDSSTPIGALLRVDASVSDVEAGSLWYRFRARRLGEDFRMVRDYGPDGVLDWATSDHEGTYEIEVSVRNNETGETTASSTTYEIGSRVVGGAPLISETANALVFLYSAPPCSSGGRMRVQFQTADGFVQTTPYKACRPGLSMNFQLAGLRANTAYSVRHIVDTGSGLVTGPVLPLTTPEFPLPVAEYRLLKPPPVPGSNGILLQSPIFQVTVATDLYGNLVWYYLGNLTSLSRPAPGGLFWGFYQDPASGPASQILRQFDVAGVTVRETNAARINEQLVALGKRTITSFHHEARSLPDGKVLVLANTEQILTDVQGPGPVDVLSDMILALDSNLQVEWTWDAFDHLDPRRAAVLGEVCTPSGAGCPPFYLASRANDWLHGNSLQLTPDGNIVFSIRHQDWVIKIDYNNGAGSGAVLWRLGKDGDFQIDSADPSPWFSHQHDAQFENGDNSTLMIFDNGNTRRASDASANSRGQVFRLDEANRTATLLLNADLGAYSFALGSAQKLPNGNYHFDLGILPGNTSQSVEVDPAGNIVYGLQSNTPQYRTFRMTDLYTP